MIIVVLIVSFLLDGIISNFLPSNFIPLLSLMGIIVSYEFMSFNNKDFYKYSFITGLCYDLIYTDTFAFYGILFLFISFIITKLSKFLASNYLNMILVSFICIVIFRCMTYFFLFLTGNIILNFDSLFKSIYNSLFVNVIYGFILKFICDFIVSYNLKRKKYY